RYASTWTRSWSRRWRKQAAAASSGRRSGADDPRRLDLLHLRRAWRHLRRDGRLLRRGHAFPLALSPDDQRRAAAAALVGEGRVLLGRVLPPEPARGRARARLGRDHPRAV